MFSYILLIVLSASYADGTPMTPQSAFDAWKAQSKRAKNSVGTCVVEDRLHPKTGEVLGKRVRCGI